MKVLVADDEPGLRSLVSTVLQELGHSVLTAHNPRRALELLSADAPDLLILDTMMPGPDGREVVRTLDGELGLGSLPLILMTPHGHRHWLPEGHEPAVVLPKPFDVRGLMASVDRVTGPAVATA